MDTDPVGIELTRKSLMAARPDARMEIARSGPEAVGMLRDRHFDLLLLEGPFSVRRATGIFLELRDQIPDGTRTLALTSDPEPEALEEWCAAGVDDVMYTPVSFDLFIRDVSEFLRKHL